MASARQEPARRPDCTFWPDQVLKDAVACLAVLAVVLSELPGRRWATATGSICRMPGDVLGAELGAPADRPTSISAARPEWYFLFLFQFLKSFRTGETGEFMGAIVVPGVVMALLFLMPLVRPLEAGAPLQRWPAGLPADRIVGS